MCGFCSAKTSVINDNTVMTSLINIKSPLTDATMMGAEIYATHNSTIINRCVGSAMAQVSVIWYWRFWPKSWRAATANYSRCRR
jgi:hypothetical protein